MLDSVKDSWRSLRRFAVTTLMMLAVSAHAQDKIASTNSGNDNEDIKDKTTLVTDSTTAQVTDSTTAKSRTESTFIVGVGNVAGLTLREKKVEFYDDLAPKFSASIEGQKGFYGRANATELIIMGSDGNITPITATFMLEVGKKLEALGPDAAIMFRAGREPTEIGHVFDNPLSYYADSYNMGYLGNSSEVVEVGIKKDNQTFIKLGYAGKTGDGAFVFANPANSAFWVKGGVPILNRSGLRIWMDAGARLGNGQKTVLGSLNMSTDSGFGMTTFGNYDFTQNKANFAVRAYKNLRNDWQVVAETMINNQKDLFVRAGAGHKGLEFSFEYAKPNTGPKGVSFTIAHTLSYSHKIK